MRGAMDYEQNVISLRHLRKVGVPSGQAAYFPNNLAQAGVWVSDAGFLL
jgi:hypothetical protein